MFLSEITTIYGLLGAYTSINLISQWSISCSILPNPAESSYNVTTPLFPHEAVKLAVIVTSSVSVAGTLENELNVHHVAGVATIVSPVENVIVFPDTLVVVPHGKSYNSVSLRVPSPLIVAVTL